MEYPTVHTNMLHYQANYSIIVPPHSLINAMDYSDPKDLARRLKEIMANETEYLSYFWWKDFYRRVQRCSEFEVAMAQSGRVSWEEFTDVIQGDFHCYLVWPTHLNTFKHLKYLKFS